MSLAKPGPNLGTKRCCCLSLAPVAGVDCWEWVWIGYGDAGLRLPETAETDKERVIADELSSGERAVIVRRWEKKRSCSDGQRRNGWNLYSYLANGVMEVE